MKAQIVNKKITLKNGKTIVRRVRAGCLQYKKVLKRRYAKSRYHLHVIRRTIIKRIYVNGNASRYLSKLRKIRRRESKSRKLRLRRLKLRIKLRLRRMKKLRKIKSRLNRLNKRRSGRRLSKVEITKVVKGNLKAFPEADRKLIMKCFN